jgi:26S proteasome regulatory subunit N6
MDDDRDNTGEQSAAAPSAPASAPATAASVLHEALESAATPDALRALIIAEVPAHQACDEDLRVKELAVTRLCALYVAAADMASLRALLAFLRPFFALIPKARTAKIVRSVIEALGRVPGSTEVLVAVCTETVEWCKAEKRSFLRLRVQLKLSQLCVGTRERARASRPAHLAAPPRSSPPYPLTLFLSNPPHPLAAC